MCNQNDANKEVTKCKQQEKKKKKRILDKNKQGTNIFFSPYFFSVLFMLYLFKVRVADQVCIHLIHILIVHYVQQVIILTTQIFQVAKVARLDSLKRPCQEFPVKLAHQEKLAS